jgi:hypothetical protein
MMAMVTSDTDLMIRSESFGELKMRVDREGGARYFWGESGCFSS